MTVVTRRLLHFHLAVRRHTYPLHHFSSSSDAGPPSDIPQPQPQPESQPSFSSYFSEVKATLQKEPPPHNRPYPLRKPSTTPSQTPPLPKLDSLEGVRRNISGFRSSSASSPPSSGSDKYVSLQELYKRNVIAMPDKSATSSNLKPPASPSFDAIRESIHQLRVNPPPAKNENDSRGKNDQVSLARFNENLKLKPDQNLESPLIFGGSESLPSFLEKEKGGSKNDYVGGTASMRTEFLKMYDYSELGTKLKMLRPEKKKQGRWFSLQELNERLGKLRLIEEKESQGRMRGISFKDLRESLVKLSLSEDDETKMKRSKFIISA